MRVYCFSARSLLLLLLLFFAKTKENKNESHIEDALILTTHRIPSSAVDLSSMKKAVAANSTSAVVEKKKERIENRERV